MLKTLDLDISYTSEEDDIYEDFFIPVLSTSVEYKRAVGYFSLSVLLNTPAAMSEIIENNGKIKIDRAKSSQNRKGTLWNILPEIHL